MQSEGVNISLLLHDVILKTQSSKLNSGFYKLKFMVKVGITGGIGSGKSVLCEIWQSLGAYIVNADDIAKNLIVNNEKLRQKIVEVFGKKAFRANGSLNRKYLAEEAFGKGKVEELNKIVHPVVIKNIERQIEYAKQQGYEAVIYEAALLLQHLRPKNLDYVVLVLADENKRIDRVARRDEVGKKLVVDRINHQQDFDELKDRADIVVDNNESLSELKSKAHKIYQRFFDTEN